ncbi:MAG: hypothetical protein ACRBCJ_12330 [Hyphomicrobiaceae bacterium]
MKRQAYKTIMSSEFLDFDAPEDIRPLDEAAAVDIWIARWLRMRRVDLIRRYDCDPRRLYEIWEEKRFPGSREKALKRFRNEFPGLLDRVDFGTHRRIPRRAVDEHEGQLTLFEETSVASIGAG